MSHLQLPISALAYDQHFKMSVLARYGRTGTFIGSKQRSDDSRRSRPCIRTHNGPPEKTADFEEWKSD